MRLLRLFRNVTRPSHDRVIFYFDAYKDQFGVEAIRRVLKKADREFVTSRGYRKATTRAGVSGRRVDAPRDDDQPEGTGSSPGPCTAKLPSTSTRKVLRSRHSLRSQPVGICLHRAYRGCLQPKNVCSATRSTMRTDALPLEVLEHALMTARRIHGNQLIHHSDQGSPYVSPKYSTALAEAGIRPSVGTVGDLCGNVLAETINGLYEAENHSLTRSEGVG